MLRFRGMPSEMSFHLLYHATSPFGDNTREMSLKVAANIDFPFSPRISKILNTTMKRIYVKIMRGTIMKTYYAANVYLSLIFIRTLPGR
jgi:hypothetical protein